jgi:hypothetical protein
VDQPKKPSLSEPFMRAWGLALVQTGLKHADLGLLRQGKKMLQRLADQQAAASSDPNRPAA